MRMGAKYQAICDSMVGSVPQFLCRDFFHGKLGASMLFKQI